MSGGLFALLAVTVGFAGLVYWVYSPRRRRQLEDHGRIPLDDENGAAAAARRTGQPKADGDRDE